MGRSPARQGLTLVEVLIAVSIIAVLMGILVPTFAHVRGKARAASCAANLSQVVMAAKMYYQDYSGPPLTDLRVALADYVDSAEVFVCPEDRGSRDSYSAFFVARHNPTGEQFVVGCPRHCRGKDAVVALGKGDTSAGQNLQVTCDGREIGPGETVTGGELQFSDGSHVVIAPDMTVGVLLSVTNHGRPYSIIWVPKGSEGRIDCSVTPGSAFEVVTPAAIAGVQGTEFTVWVEATSNDGGATGTNSSLVQVHEGKVLVEHRVKKLKRLLRAGDYQRLSTSTDKVPQDSMQQR